MKKTSKKKITIESLAGMVQRGFLETNKRFDNIDEKLEQVDKRFDKIEKDIKDLKDNFNKILDALDKVAKHYDAYVEEIKLRDVEIERLKRWIEQIAQKVGIKLAD